MKEKILVRLASFLSAVALWSFTTAASAQTTVEYIHTDALGTPVAVTDAAGVVVERSEYEPFGQLVNRPLTDGPGFTGHVQDAATGLTYMQQRYYDPLIGRFLSVDPVTAYGSPGANFNRYWYANNNPYKFTDPDGRAPAPQPEETDRLEELRRQAEREREVRSFASVLRRHKTPSSQAKLMESVGSDPELLEYARETHQDFAELLISLVGGGGFAGGARGGLALRNAANFSRELRVADLGLKGSIQELRGTFALKDGIATIRVDMIKGRISNPLKIVGNMINTAKANGATMLRIEGTIAEPRLYNALQSRYGLTTNGATDVITVPVR